MAFDVNDYQWGVYYPGPQQHAIAVFVTRKDASLFANTIQRQEDVAFNVQKVQR